MIAERLPGISFSVTREASKRLKVGGAGLVVHRGSVRGGELSEVVGVVRELIAIRHEDVCSRDEHLVALRVVGLVDDRVIRRDAAEARPPAGGVDVQGERQEGEAFRHRARRGDGVATAPGSVVQGVPAFAERVDGDSVLGKLIRSAALRGGVDRADAHLVAEEHRDDVAGDAGPIPVHEDVADLVRSEERGGDDDVHVWVDAGVSGVVGRGVAVLVPRVVCVAAGGEGEEGDEGKGKNRMDLAHGSLLRIEERWTLTRKFARPV